MICQRFLSSSTSKGPVDSFKNLAKRLARDDEIKTFQNISEKSTNKDNKIIKKKLKLVNNPSVAFVQNGLQHKIQIKEPLTFAKTLEKSTILSQLEDDMANEFLDEAAEFLEKNNSSKSSEIDWNSAMELVKESEKTYFDTKVNKHEIMDRPGVHPIQNIASFVNQSPALQRLVDLGTKIGQWETKDRLDLAFQLNFEKDIVPRIHFLVDNGVNPNRIGDLFTENPGLFDQSMDDLQVRINYLSWRKFNKNQVLEIILSSNSKWLNFKVPEIDFRLGFIQKLFGLKPQNVRVLASTCPKLIIWKGTPEQVENNQMDLKHAMGFTDLEMRKILLTTPKVFMEKDSETIQERFDILHNEIGYSHELITKLPQCLLGDALAMKSRLKFLQKLGRDQFNPEKPNYVNPEVFATSTDVIFCSEIAKVPVELFNKFQQTI